MDKLPELRVFVSSTFRDLHDEREYLGKKVFPEIRQLCHERGVHFTEIDLRWGLTKEDADSGRIIRTCLEEIDQCRPFFIGMLGDRYGWIPGAEEVNKDADLYTKYPWIRKAVAEDHSVTEMEFYYGVLMAPEATDSAFFYFRERGGELSKDLYDRKRLEELKQKVRNCGKPVFDYKNSLEFGQRVRTDLLKVLDTYWPMSSKPSWLEQERREHEAFASSRRRSYIARAENLEQLNHRADLGGKPLVISGESGSGKSALLAFWTNHHRSQHPGAFVIEHYLGATSSGNDHLMMLRRIMSEIKERYGLEEDLPNEADQIEREFPIWLARVQKEKLILVLDGMNQLEGRAANMQWLPSFIPSNVALLISASRQEILDNLHGRNWEQLRVEPLNVHEREDLTVRFLAEFRKRLSRDQRQRIAHDKKASSPLFLRTILEELRLFGKFEELDNRIAYYLESAGIHDLFQRVLARMEEDYGRDMVREVMRLLWSAPQGLSESELIAVSGLARADLSMLLLALEYHLVRLQGVLSFSHNYLREAVAARYLAEEDLRLIYWRKLADFFETTEASQRKAHALPWLLIKAGEMERLRDALSQLGLFKYLGREDKRYELIAYWMQIGSVRDIAQAYHQSVAEWPDESRLSREYWETLILLGEFFRDSGFYEDAEPFLVEAVEVWAELAETRDEALAHSMSTLANIRIHKGDLNGAEPLLKQATEIYTELFTERDARTAKTLNDRVWLMQQRGAFAEAETLSAHVVELYQKIFGMTHPQTAHSLSHRASLLRELGRYDAAEELMRQVITIYESTHGPEYPDTAGSLNELGDLKRVRGDYPQAEELLRKALFILNAALGNIHPHVCAALTNLGATLRAQGKYTQAEALYRRAVNIAEIVYGENHAQTATGLNNLALVLKAQEKYEQAIELFRRTVGVYEKVLGPKHPYSAAALANLASSLREAKLFEEAESTCRRSLEIREETLGPNHPSTGRSVYALAQVMRDSGRENEAVGLFTRALAIQEATVGTEHPDTAATLHDLGEILILRGEYVNAEPLLARALAIRERALGSEHADTARTMAQIAKVYMDTGQADRGQQLYELAYAVQHRILGADHPDTRKLWAILDSAIQSRTGTQQ